MLLIREKSITGGKIRINMAPKKKQRLGKTNNEEENRIRKLLLERENETRKRVNELSVDKLRDLVNSFISREPGVIFNLLEEMENPPTPKDNIVDLSWCVCGECREMATMAENVCCRSGNCLSKCAEFSLLVLEPMVLNLANQYRNDIFVLDINENMDDHNKSLRHAAYRQFTMWRCGYLGANNRKVIPSCCVWTIRDKFPNLAGNYTGYRANRLA